MKNYIRIILDFRYVFAIVICLILSWMYLDVNGNHVMGKEIYNRQITNKDFLKTEGKYLRNEYGTGSKVILKGVNVGGWFVQELWMTPTAYGPNGGGVQDQKTIESTLKKRFGEEKTKELLDTYYDNFWTEEDFDNCRDMEMNVLRLPFWYLNIVDEGGKIKNDAFDRIDWFVEQAGKRGIYVILDMHGAPGSQNDRDHSGDIFSNKGLWQGADVMYYQNLFLKIWKEVAKHYNGNPVVAGYDLLNEPYCAAGDYTDKQVWDLYDRAYDEIRKIDKNHVIIMEATWEPYNLPRPERYGWTNVMYEYHSYNYDNQTNANEQLAALKRKLDLIKKYNYDVPSYIGETSFFGNTQSWTKCLSELNSAEINWTLWSYKVKGNGTNTWGLYNMNIPDADLVNDSYDTIKEKWAASKTDKAYTNNAIHLIVDKFISYPPTLIKIGDATVSSIANAIYSGRAITPDVTVKRGNITLVKNRDYTLKYSDNIECGTAVVTVVGAGRYDGIQKVCFKIVPEALKGFKVQSQTTKSISIRWKKSNNADGYHLYQYKNRKYVIIKTLKPYHTSFQVSKLRPGTAYKFKICSYKRIDGKIYEGKVSTLTARTKVSAVKLKVKTKGKIIKLSWKKVRGAKGYEIYISSKKNGKYKKIASNKKTGYDYVIKKGGKFYIKVRAYSSSGSKKIYGAYSKVFKVAVK